MSEQTIPSTVSGLEPREIERLLYLRTQAKLCMDDPAGKRKLRAINRAINKVMMQAVERNIPRQTDGE